MDLVINLILNIRLVNLEIDQMQELSHEILLNCLEIQHLQTKNPRQRYTYEKSTGTLHRFSPSENDGSLWHWSGSTNQGPNSLKGSQVPNDIKNLFHLPKKGW